MTDRKPIRCAIYTRKSSEEGLEQSFNSLDAQREACRAYIQSQRHEGWRPVAAHYDDGGYSGGSMERPALKRLLEDIAAGKVDAVVVYKVDRLTRSLSDFAKIIDVFDKRGASFVSVTQQFNTTSSMGRLTLNVLLSFAQFEREVTGERIRDKIAASKRKGMWMGGNVPLGYDLKARKLLVNTKEAALVRDVFRRYLALACVRKLKLDLERRGVKSKVRTSPTRRRFGGTPYSRGALHKILRNRIYLGEIAHKGQVFAGEHDAIVPRQLWEDVQARLRINNEARRDGTNCSAPSLLVGLLFDDLGNRYTPSHAVKDGKRYRYYVSQAAIQHHQQLPSAPSRIPAHEIEQVVIASVRAFLQRKEELRQIVGSQSGKSHDRSKLANSVQQRLDSLASASFRLLGAAIKGLVDRVVVHHGEVQLLLSRSKIRLDLLGEGLTAQHSNGNDLVRVVNRISFRRCGVQRRLLAPVVESAHTSIPSLIKAVARANDWHRLITTGEIGSRRALKQALNVDESYIGRIIRCAFLAPDIVEAILDGKQPPHLTLTALQGTLPASWAEQRRRFGSA
jgi:site-specific DNA recombinase